MRARMTSVMTLLFLTATGCSILPPMGYVTANRATHDQYKYIVDTFAAQNPADAQVAEDLWQSEETLIHNAENGQYPSVIHPAGSVPTIAPRPPLTVIPQVMTSPAVAPAPAPVAVPVKPVPPAVKPATRRVEMKPVPVPKSLSDVTDK